MLLPNAVLSRPSKPVAHPLLEQAFPVFYGILERVVQKTYVPASAATSRRRAAFEGIPREAANEVDRSGICSTAERAERWKSNTRQHRRRLGQGEGCVCVIAGKAGRGRVAS